MPAIVASEEDIQAAADAVREAERALNADRVGGGLVEAGATELQTIHGAIPRVHVKLARPI